MKNLFIVVFLSLFLSGQSQSPNPPLSVNIVRFFPDANEDFQRIRSANMTFTFTTINKVRYVTLINKTDNERHTFFLTTKKETVEPLAGYVVFSYLCKDITEPGILLMSFMFYKNTKKLTSVGLSDGVGLLIYEIYYEPDNL